MCIRDRHIGMLHGFYVLVLAWQVKYLYLVIKLNVYINASWSVKKCFSSLTHLNHFYFSFPFLFPSADCLSTCLSVCLYLFRTHTSVSYTHLDVYKRQHDRGHTTQISYKLAPNVGPYTITRDKGNNTYEITHPVTKKIKGVYNHCLLYTSRCV